MAVVLCEQEGVTCNATLYVVFRSGPRCRILLISPLCPYTTDSISVIFPLFVSKSRSEWAIHLSTSAELISCGIPPTFECAIHEEKVFERTLFFGCELKQLSLVILISQEDSHYLMRFHSAR